MKKILFVRKYKKTSGGQIKVRDYFWHCLAHPQLEPYVYFTPESQPECDGTWAQLPPERRVAEPRLAEYDWLFLAGRDWDFIPAVAPEQIVINLLQHVRHGDPSDPRFAYLVRPAHRICVSAEVEEAVAPHAVGTTTFIPYGVPLEIFTVQEQKRADTIFIWARKNPALGKTLQRELAALGAQVTLLVDYLPREEFAASLRRSDILVALPNPREGFFLPALEGMASGCAVVCADAEGNRGFSIHGETCLMPKIDDAESHLAMIKLLLQNRPLKEALQKQGAELALSYSMPQERENFYRFLRAQQLV